MTHIRFDGYRVVNRGIYSGGGTFCGHGHLCNRNSNKPDDRLVSIYFVRGAGYQYKE